MKRLLQELIDIRNAIAVCSDGIWDEIQGTGPEMRGVDEADDGMASRGGSVGTENDQC